VVQGVDELPSSPRVSPLLMGLESWTRIEPSLSNLLPWTVASCWWCCRGFGGSSGGSGGGPRWCRWWLGERPPCLWGGGREGGRREARHLVEEEGGGRSPWRRSSPSLRGGLLRLPPAGPLHLSSHLFSLPSRGCPPARRDRQQRSKAVPVGGAVTEAASKPRPPGAPRTVQKGTVAA